MKKKNESGFTLVETIVYMGLFGIVLGGLVLSAYLLMSSAGRSTARACLEADSHFILQKIAFALKRSADICQPVHDSGNELVLSIDASCDFVVQHSGSNVLWDDRPLNSDDVRVDRLTFVHRIEDGLDLVEVGLDARIRTPDGTELLYSASTSVYLW